MARQWGQGDSLAMFAPTLAGELARHDRASFERASASPGMIRALVESLTVTDVRNRLAEVAVPALVVHRRSDFVPFSDAKHLPEAAAEPAEFCHRHPGPDRHVRLLAPGLDVRYCWHLVILRSHRSVARTRPCRANSPMPNTICPV
jgi:pimeloyl-ACP methyl ester carboxylesterase